MEKRKIAISGINGFVGGNVKTYLNEAFNIYGLSRTPKPLSNIYSYNENLIDIFNETDAIIHLAGKAHDLKNTSQAIEYYKANTDLTIKLFDQFLESNCKIFIFFSSVKAVADSVEDELLESITPNPKSVYGKSKLKAENYLLSIKLPDSKKLFILRPCMIHGPNNKGNLNVLYNFVNKGIPYPLGSYQNLRSFVSVQNVCFIIEKLLTKDIESGIYNIADSERISTLDLVKIIGEAIDKKVNIIKTPKVIIRLIAKLGDKIKLIPLDSEKLDKLTENFQVSNSKIVSAIGEELPLNSKKGLVLTVKSFN